MARGRRWSRRAHDPERDPNQAVNWTRPLAAPRRAHRPAEARIRWPSEFPQGPRTVGSATVSDRSRAVARCGAEGGLLHPGFHHGSPELLFLCCLLGCLQDARTGEGSAMAPVALASDAIGAGWCPSSSNGGRIPFRRRPPASRVPWCQEGPVHELVPAIVPAAHNVMVDKVPGPDGELPGQGLKRQDLGVQGGSLEVQHGRVWFPAGQDARGSRVGRGFGARRRSGGPRRPVPSSDSPGWLPSMAPMGCPAPHAERSRASGPAPFLRGRRCRRPARAWTSGYFLFLAFSARRACRMAAFSL
jgi:hypothetical protein